MIKRILGTAAVVGLAMALPAQATYSSIQANLLDGVDDTTFSGGVLSIMSNTSDLLTLNDSGFSFPGVYSNTVFSLNIGFDHVFFDGPDLKAAFKNGTMSLNFDYDPDGVGPDPAGSFFISGPVATMIFGVTLTGPTSIISGEGLFTAGWDLPGSNNWPAPNKSSLKSLSFAFQQNLSNFDWTSDLVEGRIESQITLLPNDSAVPAPPALLLLLPGMALLRRRR